MRGLRLLNGKQMKVYFKNIYIFLVSVFFHCEIISVTYFVLIQGICIGSAMTFLQPIFCKKIQNNFL